MRTPKTLIFTFIALLAALVYSQNSKADIYQGRYSNSTVKYDRGSGWGEWESLNTSVRIHEEDGHVTKITIYEGDKIKLLLQLYDNPSERSYNENGWFRDGSDVDYRLRIEQDDELVRVYPSRISLTKFENSRTTINIYYETPYKQMDGIGYGMESLNKVKDPIIDVDYELFSKLRTISVKESPLNISFDYTLEDGKIEGMENVTSILIAENNGKNLMLVISKSDTYNCDAIYEIVSEEENYFSADEYVLVALDNNLERDDDWLKIYRSRDEIKLVYNGKESVIEKFSANEISSVVLDPIGF